jgi:hypothetical protein
MKQATAPRRNQLRRIARQAMLERGLLPDFSAAVVAETGSIANAATASDSSLRDVRHLLWASIDNDDSLDLDQLSVAEQLPGGVVKIFVAVADVDAIVKKAAGWAQAAASSGVPPRFIGLVMIQKVVCTGPSYHSISSIAVGISSGVVMENFGTLSSTDDVKTSPPS